MLPRTLVAIVLLLAGCPASPKPDPSTGSSAGSGSAPAPQPPAQDSSVTSPSTGPKIGEPCGAADACGEGTCVKFFGIAGPRGPEFKQCEIKCDAKAACPDGRKCITIADGPGQVCR